LPPAKRLALFFGMGVVSGTIGINYAHELMHQKSRWNDGWPTSSLPRCCIRISGPNTCAFITLYVGTPRDPVTARYNEGFHRFFPRVLRQCPQSAWKAEAAMLARKGEPTGHRSNPFWRYALLQGAFLPSR
jgi:alkane 1-monooxygenase